MKEEKGFEFEKSVLPEEFRGLLNMETRVTIVKNSWEEVREIVKKQVEEEIKGEV